MAMLLPCCGGEPCIDPGERPGPLPPGLEADGTCDEGGSHRVTACPEGDPGDARADAPRITDFAYVRQFDGDPRTLIFTLGFEDADGDLGRDDASRDDDEERAQGPRLDIWLDCGLQRQWLEMDDLFLQNDLDLDATSGDLGMALRFDQVEQSTELRLGVQLFDLAGHRSNFAWVRLQFSPQGGSSD